MTSIGSLLFQRHKDFWTKVQRLTFIKAGGFLGLALLFQFLADHYVLHVNSVPVGDIILSNIPTVDLDFFVIQGALILTFLIIGLLIYHPRYIPFTISALALFIAIRAFFISLTHLGVDPHQLVLDTSSFGYGLFNVLYNTKSDFFFSGHTGIPFLMGLIWWDNKFWRRVFFAISLLLGASVLLAHIHYSIDVFAAPFMTYTIFVIAKKLFPQEYALTQELKLAQGKSQS